MILQATGTSTTISSSTAPLHLLVMSQETRHFTLVKAGILVLIVALGFMVARAWESPGVSASPGNESPEGSVSAGKESPAASMASEFDGRQVLATNTYPVAFREWLTGAPVVARRVRVLSGDEGTTVWQGQTNADGAIDLGNTVESAIAELSIDDDWRQVSRVSPSNPIVRVHPLSELVVRLEPELRDSEARLCRLEMQVVDGPSGLPRFESDRRLWEVRGAIGCGSRTE